MQTELQRKVETRLLQLIHGVAVKPSIGVCCNLLWHAHLSGPLDEEKVYEWMKRQFIDMGLHPQFPVDDGSFQKFKLYGKWLGHRGVARRDLCEKLLKRVHLL